MILWNLPLCSNILPYYGYTHSWILMLLQMWRASRSFCFKNMDILVKIILKSNKMNISISSIPNVKCSLSLFVLRVTTEVPDELEALACIVDELEDPTLLSISESEWKITQQNLKSFWFLLSKNPGIDLSKINVELSQECLKRSEIMNWITCSAEPYKLPSFNLTLCHNEMVFPNIVQYKKIMQESVVGFNRLSTNIAMVEVLRKSKVTPNKIISNAVKSVSLDWDSQKRRNNYSLSDSMKYLLESFPHMEELVIGGTQLTKEKFHENFQNLINVNVGNLNWLKFFWTSTEEIGKSECLLYYSKGECSAY